MEPPIAFEADALRDEKVRVLRAIDTDWTEARVRASVVRGQYTAGWVGDKHVPGYREEDEVAPDSKVETFVALKLRGRRTGAGPTCPSTCAPASGCRGARPRSRSSSSCRR